MSFGTHSGGGLGFGVAFTLEDQFSAVADRINAKFEVMQAGVQAQSEKINNSLGMLYSGMALIGTGIAVLAPLGFGVKLASEFEATEVSLTTMLGSAEKAKQLLTEISDFALKTPFELKDVEKGTKQLLAYGVTAEDVMKDFEGIGNIAAGLNVPIDNLVRAFGQIKGKGTLKGQEFNQFAEAGFNVIDALKLIGVNVDLTKGDIGTFGITFDQVRAAIRATGEEGGKFNHLMDKMSETAQGKMSNIKDSISRTFRIIGQQLMPIVKPALQLFLDLVSKISAFANTSIGKMIIDFIAFGLVLVSLVTIVAGLKIVFIALGAVIWTTLAPILEFILPIMLLAGAFIFLMESLSAFNSVMEGNKPADGFLGLMQKTGGVLQGLIEAWNSWDSKTQTFMLPQGLTDMLEMLGLLDTTLALATWLVRIKEFLKGIKEAFKTTISELKMIWQGLKDAVQPILDDLGLSIDRNTSSTEHWKTAGKIFGAVIVAALVAIVLWLGIVAISWIAAFAVPLAIMAGIALAIYLIIELILALIDVLKDAWEILQGFWTDAKDFFTDLGSMFVGIGKSMYDAGVSAITSLWEGIKSIWDKMTDWIKEGWDGIKDFFTFGDNKVNNTVTHSGDVVQGGGLGQALAETKAASSTPVQPVVFDKSTSSTKVESVNLHLDGDLLYKTVLDKNNINDAREE